MTVSSDMLRSISTTENLETRLGTLDFLSGVDKSQWSSEIEVVI